MNDQINWGQKRHVFYSPDSDEYYIRTMPKEYMLDHDYIEGGRTLHEVQVPSDIVEVGVFTNAEIDQHKYEQGGHGNAGS